MQNDLQQRRSHPLWCCWRWPNCSPPLTGEQLAALETDLLKNGGYSPIIINKEGLIWI